MNLMRAKLMTKGYENAPLHDSWVKTRYTGACTIVGIKCEDGNIKVVRNIYTKSGFQVSHFVFTTENMDAEEIMSAL